MSSKSLKKSGGKNIKKKNIKKVKKKRWKKSGVKKSWRKKIKKVKKTVTSYQLPVIVTVTITIIVTVTVVVITIIIIIPTNNFRGGKKNIKKVKKKWGQKKIIIKVTAKKRDQLAPRFGTSVCWTPIAAFKPS